MTTTPAPELLDPDRPHPFRRGPERSWRCLCGKNHKSRVHHGGQQATGTTTAGRTVAAARAAPGTVVLTTDVTGTDFGLPLVDPTRGRGGFTRTVRSHLRESGGTVVRFTDGSKTRPLNGRTVFTLAEDEAPGEVG